MHIQIPPFISDAEDESDGNTISAPPYCMITVTDDNADSMLTDEQSDVTTIEDVEVEENTIQQEEEITAVSDV